MRSETAPKIARRPQFHGSNQVENHAILTVLRKPIVIE
jgi:hypothetical protein